MILDTLKAKQYKNAYKTKTQQKDKKGDAEINKTLKGVLINNYKKNTNEEGQISFDEIQDSLLMYEEKDTFCSESSLTKQDSIFNAKKAITPLVIGTGLILASCLGISSMLKKSSKHILNTKNFEQLPDLAVNMNIKDEVHFSLYRAIRDPNFKNVAGALGVITMTGLTVIAQNFVEGAKEIWIKKKSSDIEKNLQEGLIEVETNAFSGKLKVVNDLLNKNVKHFDSILNAKKESPVIPPIFEGIMSFKGNSNDNPNKNNTDNSELMKNLKYIALVAGMITSTILVGKFSLSNLRKTVQNSNAFANNITLNTIDAIQTLSEKADKNDLPRITELLKAICVKPEFVEEIGKKYNLSEN